MSQVTKLNYWFPVGVGIFCLLLGLSSLVWGLTVQSDTRPFRGVIWILFSILWVLYATPRFRERYADR
jgi:hypothetical protein